MASYNDQFAKVSQEYRSGQRTYPEWLLGNTSVVGGMFGDMLGTALDYMVPDELGVGENIAKAGQYIANTDMGKAIGKAGSEFAQENPRFTRNALELLGASEAIMPARALMNPKGLFHKYSANLPNDMNFGDDKFYLPKVEAEARAKERFGGKMYEQNPQAAVNFEQKLSRFRAMGKGFALGLANTFKQSATPEGQALWREKGVSKTLFDIAKDPIAKPEVKWGQPAYERLLGSQYGDVSPILKQLDNEYFTNEGVFNFADFAKHTGHAPQDADAFFRTIAANNKIKPNDDYIMVVRKPTGTEGSGDLVSDMMFTSQTGRMLPKIFEPQQSFKSADDFLDMYDIGKRKGGAEMAPERRRLIKRAFDENPELANIADRGELTKQLNTITSKLARKQGMKPFKNKNYVDAAMKRAKKAEFESNDALAAALEAKGLKVLRNKTQKKDPDVYLVDSVASSAYELGGVNVVYKIQKDGIVKAQVSDVNDLEAVGAPMGKKLITVTPVVEKNLMNPEKRPKETATGLSDVYADVNTPTTPKAIDYANAAATQAGTGALAGGGMLSAMDEDIQP